MTPHQRIAALEVKIGELTQTVERLQRDRARSMKRLLACPVCGGRRLVHVRRFKEATHGGYVDLALTHTGFWTTKFGGPLEIFACKSCGLVEWHVTSFDDVKVDGEDVVEIERPADAEPDPDPYR